MDVFRYKYTKIKIKQKQNHLVRNQHMYLQSKRLSLHNEREMTEI
jgi:hypothetical protein